KEQLGLEKTQRRFSFAQLKGSAELRRIVNEAHALKRAEKPLDRAQQEALRISDRLAFFGRVMDGSALLIVPAPGNKTDTWLAPDATTVVPYYNEMQFQAAQTRLQALANAYAQGDAFNFSLAAHQARSDLRALSPSIYPTESQLQLEYFYNHFEGFYRAAWCYGIALLLLAIAYFRAAASPAVSGKRSYLKIAGVIIAIAALLFHASGIVMRCLIAGRPPVTNMYESIIW